MHETKKDNKIIQRNKSIASSKFMTFSTDRRMPTLYNINIFHLYEIRSGIVECVSVEKRNIKDRRWPMHVKWTKLQLTQKCSTKFLNFVLSHKTQYDFGYFHLSKCFYLQGGRKPFFNWYLTLFNWFLALVMIFFWTAVAY